MTVSRAPRNASLSLKTRQTLASGLLSLGGFCGLMPSACADDYLYTVKAGDNPWSISSEYLIDMSYWPRLQSYNQLRDARRIPPGTTLRIPPTWLRMRGSGVQLSAVHGSVEADLGKGWVALPATPEGGALPVLPAGARLRTGINSSAVLTLNDGAKIRVRPSTAIKLSKLSTNAQNAAVVQIELLSGGLENAVHPLRESGGRMEIVTPAATTAVRGTTFRVSVSDDGARTEVLDGAVDMLNPQGQVQLESNQGSVARVGEIPLPARALLDAPDLSQLPAKLDRLPWPEGFQAQAGALAYRIQILRPDPKSEPPSAGEADKRNEPTLLIEQQSTRPELPDDAATRLTDGRYLMRLRAIDALGLEGQVAEKLFELDTQPAAPQTAWPPQNAWVPAGQPQLRWQAADLSQGPYAGETAPSYRIQISSQPDFAQLTHEALTPALSWTAPRLNPGKYYWHVASLVAADQGPYTAARVLNIPAGWPELSTIEVGQQLTIRWQAPTSGGKSRTETPVEAEAVRLQIASDADFSHILFDSPAQAGVLRLPRPSPGRYHLRIAVLDSESDAPAWSSVRSLEVPASGWPSISPLYWVSQWARPTESTRRAP